MAAIISQQPSRFSDKKYVNWLKSTLYLMYLKEGIEDVIDTEAIHFHHDLQKTLGVYGSAPKCCCSCTSKCITPDYRRKIWHMSCTLCNSWLQQIILDHRLPFPKLNPANTNPKLWPTNEFEVCKLFMPYGCQLNLSAKDADLQGLLSLVKNCKHYRNCGRIGQLNLVDALLEIRNSRLHSGDFKVDDADLQVDMQTAKDFLLGLTSLSAPEHQAVQKALDQIKQLHTGRVDLSLDRELELEALLLKQNAIDTKLSEIKERTIKTEDDVNTFQTEAEANKTKQNAIDTKLSEIKERTIKAEDDVNTIQTEAEANKTKQNAIYTKLSELKERTNKTEDDVNAIQTEAVANKTKLLEVDALVSSNATDLKTLAAKTESNEQNIQKLQEVKELFNRFLRENNLEQDLALLSTRMQQQEQAIQEHTRSIESHQQQLLTQQTELKTQKTQTSDIQSQLLAHEDTLSLHGEQLRHQQQPYGPEPVTEDDLQKTLLDLYERKFRHIPVFLETKVALDDLYVGQVLKVIDPRGKSGTMEKAEEQPEEVIQSMNSIEDIFYKDGQKCENILISAEPGIGKSTLCKFLVRQWYKGHTVHETKLTKSQRAMREFKLLFYIDLTNAKIKRDAPSSDEIATIIYELLDLTDICSMTDMRKFLSKSSTLVVMDSLDELRATRIPQRGKHNKSCIVTTSRPWKIEALRLKLTDVDQHVEIVGLEKGSPTTLADNVLKLINKGSRQTKTGAQFIQDMETKELQHFLNTPLLVILMVGLWFSGESFGDSQFEIYSKVIHQQICTAIETKSLSAGIERDSERSFFSCCSIDQCPCRAYENLLRKLSKLSYHTLFNKDREMCLIFDHVQTRFYELSPEEVELCLKIGMLTQHKLLDRYPTKQNKSVSFPHKTYHEYFASIFLSSEGQASDLEHISSVISDLDQALELDKVILFCSQSKGNADVTLNLSHLISVKADADPRVLEYRESCNTLYANAPHTDLIKKIQDIIIPATDQNASVNLSDIVIDNLRSGTENKGRTIELDRLDLTVVKSITLKNVRDATDTITQFQCLQKLTVWGQRGAVESIHDTLVRNQDTLLTVGLGFFLLDMTPLGENFRQTFTGKLSSLSLTNVKLSIKQYEYFSEFASSSHNLKQMELGNITYENGGKREHSFVLDFTGHTNLHTVKLHNLRDVKISFNTKALHTCLIDLRDNLPAQTTAIQCLGTAVNLNDLTCCNITNPWELANILPQLHSLETFVLSGIQFDDLKHICLSTKLEKLRLVSMCLCSITGECLINLVNSLPRHRVDVMLCEVEVDGGHTFFDHIRKSPNTKVTMDMLGEGRVKTPDFFRFSNNIRPCQD